MVVNADLLKKHASQLKVTKDSGADYYKELFTKHPQLGDLYGAPDPDMIARAQKFIMFAMNELQFFISLPINFGQERPWRSALSNFKEHYGDVDVPLKEFNKTIDAFLVVMAKHAGGLSAEQKKSWEEMLAKAYSDMKTWGWL
ncbi:hypothetical protein Ddc_01814 [Ditylenchus destructor]|nr:hypothetical protein Ddc_01814 [Ditylenchus destructor]